MKANTSEVDQGTRPLLKAAAEAQTAQPANQERLLGFVLRLSHDLRTPLGPLLLQAQMLHRSLEPADPNRRRAEVIIESSQRISAMLQDLVELFSLEAGQARLVLRRVDLGSYVGKLQERLVGRLAVERIRVEVPADALEVMADFNQLDRILLLLLGNALQFSPAEAEVVVIARRLGEEVQLAVSDQGTGIPPDELPRLLSSPFSSQGGGREVQRGLGLYLCSLLAQAHGGRLEIDSFPGKGSEFRVILPSALRVDTTHRLS